MKLSDIIITANQSLLRNKARTALTVIAIFIGATTLSLTNGIGAGIKTYLNKQINNLGNSSSLYISATRVNTIKSESNGLIKYVPGEKKISLGISGSNSPSIQALTQSDIKKIESIPNITSVQPNVSVTPDYISTAANTGAKYQFSISQIIGSNNIQMSQGKPVSNAALVNEITIPTSYASSLGYSSDAAAVGQQVIIGISNANGIKSTARATITGVQQKSLIGSTTAYANSVLFNALYNIQTVGLTASTKDSYSTVTAVFKSNLSDAQINAIKSQLKTMGYTGETIKDMENTIFVAISAITDVFDGFAAITLVAAAFGIVNTLYMSVSERTKEIGLMKALGMGKQKIFLLFSLEAIFIGFWGSLLGVGFANLLGRMINRLASKGFLKDFTGLHLLSFPAKPSIIIIVGIMLIAFLAGTLPARRASQKDPIDALRYE